MRCPNCNSEIGEDDCRCLDCNFGICPEPKPENRPPRFLGDAGIETLELKLAREFKCPCCESYGGIPDRISTTGQGISRLLNFQCKDYLIVTCRFCGTSILKDVDKLGLDRSFSYFVDYFWSTIRLIAIIVGILTMVSYPFLP